MQPKTLGLMIDCSRNAVMKPAQVKDFAKLIAGMGYNMLQLYTEETYEVENEPYFGYMRGRYTVEELQDIDAYCRSIGVELVPCIQTLAHLSHLTRWDPYWDRFDCNDILLIDDERVYDLIENMFATLAKAFSSRRIHIGMDEAHFVGLGRYLDQHGYCNRSELLSKHLARVKDIAHKHGFTPMMWSDMYICLSNHGQYYSENPVVPQEVVDGVPEGVELVYWDYYSTDKKHYDTMFDAHVKFRNPTVFAGGIWTWTGYAPNIRYSLDASEAAMRSALERNVDTVFFTMWGDDGKDCSYLLQLVGMFAAAQFAQGNFDRADIAKKFEEYTGYSFEEALNLELPNLLDETDEPHYKNPNKYLLFNDLFIGLFDYNQSVNAAQKYAAYAKTLAASVNGRRYDYLFLLEQKLCEALAIKCDLGIRIRTAYKAGDKKALAELLATDFPALNNALAEFYAAFETVWYTENKAFGFEVQEARLGALMQRVKGCERRLQAYLDGTLETIDELDVEHIPHWPNGDNQTVIYNSWIGSISAC